MGNLNGLNLSLNHGLDLTCPTYGCLNLTQNNHRQDSDLTQQAEANVQNSTGLNLTQQSHGHASFNNSAPREDVHKKDASEVGLNLSLQNGMDLTRQTYYYDGSDFDYNSQQQSNNHFDSTAQQHRNSPLNLEHRCSPLNLTHNKFNQNQYFNFNQNQNYTSYTNYNSTAPETSDYHYQEQQNYILPTTVTEQVGGGHTNYSEYPNPVSQQSIAKIRLFCSTCSQEFATSNELNKHMEKHNSQLENNVGISINSAASVSISYTNNTSVSSGTTSLIKQASTTSTSNTPTAAGSYTNVKSYSNEFQLQDHSNSNNTLDNVMNFSCDINKIPASSSQPESMTLKVPPVSEKIKAELPAIVAPNNSTKKKSGDETKSLCSECSLAFPTGQDMKKHIDLAHRGRQGGKKYQCIQCAEEFSSVSSHKQHMELHIQEKPFRCHLCGLHLTKASGLKRHIKRIHEKIAPVHECPHCSKAFFEKFDLARHVKTHDASKRCDKCHKLLPSLKDNTRKHICKIPEAEQDPDLKCTVCGIYLETKVKWGFHMWKHTKDPIYIQTSSKPALPVKTIETPKLILNQLGKEEPKQPCLLQKVNS